MDADELIIKEREYKLERWKLLVSTITSLALVALTFVINNALQERGAILKRQEQILAEKQKIYLSLGKELNIIYVYVRDIGDFRQYTPTAVVDQKREADRQFFAYRPYWSEITESAYKDYMSGAFATYNGSGMSARLRAHKGEKVAAYAIDHRSWDQTWDAYFTEDTDAQIDEKYYRLVGALLADTISPDIRTTLQPLP